MPRAGGSLVGASPLNPTPAARPFLKWAGGKSQLLHELVPRVRAGMNGSGYHEPFIGGGALFFALAAEGLLPPRVTLSDGNPNLVTVYLAVRDEVEPLIALLADHKARHGKEHYYAVRAEVPEGAVARAARFIYLNKTCFNGLYRENAKGLYNVPMGAYTNPEICDVPNLRAASAALAGAEILCGDFGAVEQRVQPGDFVYFDPPYDPVSKTASFTAYAKGGFGEAEQTRLALLVGRLADGGVNVLLSNSMTPLVRALYGQYTLETVLASRAVNSKADRRGKIEEALVTVAARERDPSGA